MKEERIAVTQPLLLAELERQEGSSTATIEVGENLTSRKTWRDPRVFYLISFVLLQILITEYLPI